MNVQHPNFLTDSQILTEAALNRDPGDPTARMCAWGHGDTTPRPGINIAPSPCSSSPPPLLSFLASTCHREHHDDDDDEEVGVEINSFPCCACRWRGCPSLLDAPSSSSYTAAATRTIIPFPPSPSTLSSSPLEVAALAKNVSPPTPHPPPWPAPSGEDDVDWVSHLPPLDMALAATGDHPPSSQDSTFLRWIIAGEDDADLDLDHSMLPSHPSSLPFPLAGDDTKAAPFRPQLPGSHHHQTHTHAAFHGDFPSLDTAPHQPKRQHPMAGGSSPKLPAFATTAGRFVSALQPKAEAAADETTATVGQLAEAATLAEAGDVFGAREILARLNHRLPAAGTPLLRSAFYFKEALRVALSTTGGAASSTSTPVDVLLKLRAYKAFSEVSPVLQFAHFTCIQAVLDELGGAGCIHVLDFDVGVGEQWASLMQELAQRRPGAALKVTALVSPALYHPLELQLIHENLSSFATELRVPFQFIVFNLDIMDPTELAAIASGDAIAVHLPVGSVHAAAVPSILHLVRRLGAKLVISVDRSCDRSELPFAAHLIQALHSCMFLLESLDAVGTDPGVAAKIERLLIQPKIESCVIRRLATTAGDKMLPWRTMFASAGFVPVQISNFAEAQAESLLKKVRVRGFRVEKRAGSLFLHWQRAELVSVSAWRC